MGTDKISFDYKGSKFSLSLSRDGFEDNLDVYYREECENEGDPEYNCDHDYNRCMIIKDISKNEFNLFSYVANNLYETGGENNFKIVVNMIVDLLSEINFPDYIECSTDRGYYGESLVKRLENQSELFDKMFSLLATGDFKNIKLE